MLCPKCGNEIPYYVKKCGVCGADMPMIPVPENSSAKSGGCAMLVIQIFLGIISFFGILVSPASGGVAGTVMQLVGFTAFFVLGVIISAKSKNYGSIKRIITIAILYYAVWCLAINNIPEFIRAIPGSNFLYIWLIYSLVVYAVAIAVQFLAAKILAVSQKTRLLGLQYMDGDLMILQKSNRYKMAGYYLIKAKLHGIVVCKHVEEKNDSAGKTVVNMNSALTREYLADYCHQNPQVQRIVTYLQQKASAGEEVTVADIIHNVRPRPVIQSAGGLAATEATEAAKKTATKWAKVLTFSAIALVYYLGLTKLLMGMRNEKDVGNLFFGLCFSFVLVYAFFTVRTRVVTSKVSAFILKPILTAKRKRIPDFESYLQDVTLSENDMSEQEKQDILRAYATHKNSWSLYKKHVTGNNGDHSILSAVVAAELAEAAAQAAARKRSTDSGCSGCSSCGGCGGCGGCGD